MTTSIAYDRIITSLEAAGCRTMTSSTGARAQCPVHGSQSLTLSVRAEDDRARVHCFAGCRDEDVLASIGLAVRDLFDEPPRPGYVPPARPVPTPWEEVMAEVGVRNPPPLDHVLHRMVVEQHKEALGLSPVYCPTCDTATSPWSCSCGQTRTGGAA